MSEAPLITETPTETPTTTPDLTPTQTPDTTSTPASTLENTLLTAEDPAEDKPAEPAPGAPEAYADFKLPEGATLDPAVIAEATPILKELNITQEGAQKLVDFFSKHTAASVDALFAKQREVRQEWAKEAKTLLEAAPGGIKQAKADLALAKNALFANPDGTPNTDKITKFNHFMDMTGAGDNPLFIEAFTKMAKLYNEGKPVTGGGPSKFGQTAPGGGRPSIAAAVYPNLSGQS
jgi:hypothetical protein